MSDVDYNLSPEDRAKRRSAKRRVEAALLGLILFGILVANNFGAITRGFRWILKIPEPRSTLTIQVPELPARSTAAEKDAAVAKRSVVDAAHEKQLVWARLALQAFQNSAPGLLDADLEQSAEEFRSYLKQAPVVEVGRAEFQKAADLLFEMERALALRKAGREPLKNQEVAPIDAERVAAEQRRLRELLRNDRMVATAVVDARYELIRLKLSEAQSVAKSTPLGENLRNVLAHVASCSPAQREQAAALLREIEEYTAR